MLLLLAGTLVAVLVILPMVGRESKPESITTDNPSRRDAPGNEEQGGGPAPTANVTGVPLPAEKPPSSTGPWAGHTAPIRAVGFSADGRFALSGSGGYQERDGKATPVVDNSIRFWDVATGKEHRLLAGFPQGIAALAFSPDARYAVLGCAGRVKDGSWFHGPGFDVRLYDLQAEREARTFAGHTGDIFCVAISADGRRIVSGGADNTVRVWDADTGKQLHCLKGHEKAIYSVAISPKGNLALSGGSDPAMRLWDIEEGIEVQKYPGHPDAVRAVAFAPDGKLAASAGGRHAAEGGDFTIRLWDVVGGELVRSIRGHTDSVGALAFSRDGKRLLSGGQDAVRLWQAASGKELAHFGSPSGQIRGVAFSPDERRALSGGDDRRLVLWDLPLTVPALIQDLRDARRRVAAAQALGRLGAGARPAVPELLTALTEKDAELRTEALASLNRIGPPDEKDVPLLVAVLRDGDFAAGRRYALESLARLGAKAEPAVTALADALKDPSAEVRIKSAELLGIIGPAARQRAWKPLLVVLRDPDATVSAAAGAALVKMGSPGRDAVGTLKDLLGERREPLRRYALIGLAAIGGDAADAVPALLEVAAKDSVAELRGLALNALRKIQPDKKEAIEVFTQALSDGDAGVCEQAARGLASAGPKGGALPGLLQGVEHRNANVARIAADTLKAAPFDKTQAPILEKALRNKNAAVRLCAIEALGRVGADAAGTVSALGDVLKDGSADERRAVIGAIGKMGPSAREAGPRVAACLKDKDTALSREAARTLVRIEAAEVEQAVPILIKSLKITKADDAEQVAERDEARKMLVQIGKPAASGLAKSLGGEFAGGRLTTLDGRANVLARLVVVQTLEEMGPKANTPEVLLVLARLQGKDPVPAVRLAAKQARAKIQSSP